MNITSAFVNEFGKVYFYDLGVIRTIADDGTVQSLAGQPRNFGAGFSPLVARYNTLEFFDVDGDDIYVANGAKRSILQFSLTGGNLFQLAGAGYSGSPADGGDASDQPISLCGWSVPCGLIVDGVNRRLYYRSGINNAYIDQIQTSGRLVQAFKLIVVQATGESHYSTRGVCWPGCPLTMGLQVSW